MPLMTKVGATPSLEFPVTTSGIWDVGQALGTLGVFGVQFGICSVVGEFPYWWIAKMSSS